MRLSESDRIINCSSKLTRRGSVHALSIATVVVAAGATFFFYSVGREANHAGDRDDPTGFVEQKSKSIFAVTIRKPSQPPVVDTGLVDGFGQPVTVSCGTCHASRQPNFDNKTVADLNEFHSDLPFSHGTVSCLSCHNSEDYSALKLADNSRLEFTEVMTLCGQCHGPQTKDYHHGAHGGMNGHWDLTRGPREKNNCIDCHNPHSPQFPKMQPTFKPKDRFLEPTKHRTNDHKPTSNR